MSALFDKFTRIQCPACRRYISTYDNPKRRLGLISSEVTCPHCEAVLEIDKKSRNKLIAVFVLLIPVGVVLTISYFGEGFLSDVGAIVLVILSVALLVYVARTARWQVLKEGKPISDAEPDHPRERAASRGFVGEAQRPSYKYSFMTPKVDVVERYVTLFMGIFFTGLLVYWYQYAGGLKSQLALGFGVLVGLLTLIAAIRRPLRIRVELDEGGIYHIDRDTKNRMAWTEVTRVTESVLLQRITLYSHRGQKIPLSYRIEDFRGLRELLIEHLRAYFETKIRTRVFRRYPVPFLVFAAIGSFLVGLATFGIIKGLLIIHLLIIIPVALLFLLLAMRQVRSVKVTDQQVLLRRFLWPTTQIVHTDIIGLEIDEELEGFLGLPNTRAYFQCPGVIIKKRSDGTTVLPLLSNGPIPLFMAIQHNRHQ